MTESYFEVHPTDLADAPVWHALAAAAGIPREAMDQALARGWLRQLDTKLNPIFYREGLNRLTYASWLADNAVRYVALPSAKPAGLPALCSFWHRSRIPA